MEFPTGSGGSDRSSHQPVDLDSPGQESHVPSAQSWYRGISSIVQVEPPNTVPNTKQAIGNSLQHFNGKVVIPRVTKLEARTSNGRVTQACDTCRVQKAKCSGHRPTCQRCSESNIICNYTDRKGEQQARQLTELRCQVQVYEEIVQKLNAHINHESIGNFESFVVAVSTIGQPRQLVSSKLQGSPKTTKLIPPEDGQQQVNGKLIQSTKHITEDVNCENFIQATGLVGQPSAVAWLHTLRKYINQLSKPADSLRQLEEPSISSANYFLDNLQISGKDLTDCPDWPPEKSASLLVESYFRIVHASFPFIGKVYFMRQFRLFYAHPDSQPGRAWRAILNLVFAIASKHDSLAVKVSGAEHGAHMSYFTRAWQLYREDCLKLNHPNLQQVQVESLVSLYMLSMGHVNRYVH
ncbi:hypothetical protein N7451_012770 [Penicillium sp. IBT 35674x]|nr:hypothetical protein N7451_012770 [Penicillium sp. IBT 35674x]